MDRHASMAIALSASRLNALREDTRGDRQRQSWCRCLCGRVNGNQLFDEKSSLASSSDSLVERDANTSISTHRLLRHACKKMVKSCTGVISTTVQRRETRGEPITKFVFLEIGEVRNLVSGIYCILVFLKKICILYSASVIHVKSVVAMGQYDQSVRGGTLTAWRYVSVRVPRCPCVAPARVSTRAGWY
jgi:hypothetical protein